MKKVLFLSVFLIANCCIAQNDSVSLNTPAIFSVTFLDEKEFSFRSDYTTYNEVYLDVLTQDFLTIKKKFSDEKNPDAISKIQKIPLKNIKALGYTTGTQNSFGALLGMGIGFVSGTVVAIIAKSMDRDAVDPKYDSSSSTRSFTTPILVGIGSGAILGYIFGGFLNQYEMSELSMYNNDNEKKFQKIKGIISKGLNYSKKK